MQIHKAKKSLGQNFLKSEMALKKIVEAGEIKPRDIILEIGPGKGALTEKLLEQISKGSPCLGKIIAVEKDYALFGLLQEKFAKEIAEKKIVLINDDILEFDCVRQDLTQYKIIANIPYNITGAILKKFLTDKNQPERMVLMVQHEVARRIVGRGKNPSTPLMVKESILSISVKAYGEPKMIMKVPARYFSPAPKVDSAIIAIKNISRKNFLPPSPSQGEGSGVRSIDELHFWEIVKAGFAHKRKKLASNLKVLKNYENLKKNALLGKLGNKRAEDLTLEDWISLSK
jgi:16S rRNA (adenine1518-N6/adenine1519-N6)-dimethyltransferase